MRIPTILLTSAVLLMHSLGRIPAEEKPPTQAKEDAKLFHEQILPILTEKCLACHGDQKKGGLDLTHRDGAIKGGKHGPALVPGKSAESLLYQRVAKGEMPQGNPLSDEQIAAFKQWIDAGAHYEKEPLKFISRRAGADWWSLRKVAKPNPPKVTGKDWARNPIDLFVLAKLDEKGLTPAPEADRATLLRRVTYDLIGLPPTPEEIEAFVADPAKDAYEKVVDKLLASPRHGERWARHWLDVVRFAESHGYETNALRENAWPYRDYVIRAFNSDIPYPQFVLEQLAGDTVKNADLLTQSATGFLVGGAHDIVGNATEDGKRQQRMDDLDDMIAATSHTFLGLTANCARCHDHKFDPISQKDYYGMQALFAGVQHSDQGIVPTPSAQDQAEVAKIEKELSQQAQKLDDFEPVFQAGKPNRRPPVQPRRNVDRFAAVEAKFIRFTITATNDATEPCLDELEIYASADSGTNLALAKSGAKASASSLYPNAAIHQIEHLNDGRHGNSWSWISKEPGKGWAQIELPKVAKIDRVVWGRDREEKFADRLAVAYRIEAAVEPDKWQIVSTSEDRLPYKSDQKPGFPSEWSAEKQREYADLVKRRTFLLDQLKRLTARTYAAAFVQPGPTYLLKRGDAMQRGKEVSPSALAVINPTLVLDKATPEKERRLALARWITHPDNPLAARVMVNRVWHYHFGQGIVATPSDFGYSGSRPTHPELLDWLAGEFVEKGWHLKPLHRLIVLSSTYRQSCQANAKAMEFDRQNTLLWRRAPHRLEAEAVRDSILAVSGKLDLKMGGPGYQIWEPNTNYVTVFKPKAELGPAEFRRMIYQFKPRSQQDPVFGTFDCPDAALARPKRLASTTVLQALNLFNSRFTLAQADLFAQRLKRETGDDASKQVRRAFQLAFGRTPTEKELNASLKLIQDHGVSTLCRVLYNANEFLYVN